MMTERGFEKMNNRGLSLVELIVAVSMASIVAATISALIVFAIRMYKNEGTNTEMQYELQTNINMMMDEIMSSSALVVEQNSGIDIAHVNTKTDIQLPYTKYALFGNPNAKITPIGGGTEFVGFKGAIFVSSAPDSEGRFKVYMNRIAEAITPGTTIQSFAAAKAAATTGTQYLLGENLTQFVIEPDPENRSLDAVTDPSNPVYKNPIEVKVELRFSGKGWGTKEYNKHVDDVTYMRNKVTTSIYVKGASDSVFTEYKLKKKED